MITEFIKEHKKLFIIVLALIIVILIIVNIVSSKKEETENTSSDDTYMDDMTYTGEDGSRTEELDETQSTKYPDINYGVE